MVYNFDVKDVPKLNIVGGKAKALIETKKAGFPVPNGFVLSVYFFEKWLAEIKDTKQFTDTINNLNKQNCDAVKAIAEQMRFSSDQKKTIDAHLEKLNCSTYAVRSSSPEEDLEGISFAGMYETFLGTTSVTLEQNVAKAFASCFDFRVCEYKAQNGLDLSKTTIAVVVQKQVASDVSGVGFSLNPLNNAYDEVVLNASFGLGESIVSGIVTPDTYIIDTAKNRIIDKKINEKKLALWLKDDGGITKEKCKNPKQRALTDQQVMDLASLIKKCEQHYKKPMDTEWAFEDENLYLLQSRPITTYLPIFPEMLTKEGERKMLYLDMIALSQGFTESFSVLGMDIWRGIFNGMADISFPEGKDGVNLFVHGRQYILVPNLLKGMGKLGDLFINSYDGSVKRAMDTVPMDEYKVERKLPKVSRMPRQYIKVMFKMMPQILRSLVVDYRVVEQNYLDTISQIREDFASISDGKTSIIKTNERYLNNLYSTIMKQGATMAGMLAVRNVNKMFKNKGVDKYLDVLTMDSPSNPTAKMGKAMSELAAFDDVITTESADEFVLKLNEKKFSQEFLDAYESYMNTYGCRGYREIDIAVKRSYEDPAEFFRRLKDINIDDNHILTMHKRREQGYKKLLEVAKKHRFEKKFVKQADVANALFGYREDKKFNLVIGIEFLRKAVLNIADEFIKNDRLDHKNDIFDLHLEEIQNAQDDESLDIRAIREKNIAPYKKVAHVKEWPIILDSRGKIFRPPIQSEDGDLVGDAIANGKYKGKAKVMLTPNEKPLEPGEILVTIATEPSWTPIFVNASAVVMEVGGALQHGDIIAREYGIPCVSGLTGATKLIKDGDLIEVDGSNGIVKFIKKI